MKYAVLFVLALAAHAQTVIPNTKGQDCGYYSHGPYVPATLTCQAPAGTMSIALEGFYAGSFSAAAYPGYTTPTFAIFNSPDGYCSGTMTGTYVDGQVTATFSGTCIANDGLVKPFSGSTTQYIATLRHLEGGGRVGLRWVTSYWITSGSTTIY